MMPTLRLLAVAAGLACPAAASAAPPSLAGVDALVEPLVGREAPGIGVLVMQDGRLLHMKGYGLADIESGSPVDENTIFDLASVSKEMTALAAMILMEEGTLDPEVAVADTLEAFAESESDARAVVVGDLVHHTSGLPDYLDDDAQGLDYEAETTNAEVVEWLAGQPLDHEPGTRFDYSNSGYLLLASTIAAADGADSFAEVLRARILEPLGMASTGLVTLPDGVDASRRAAGYSGAGGDFEPSRSPTATEGDGNVLSSLADLARYEAALASNELLSREATARVFENGRFDDGSPLVTEEGGEEGYGYGWFLAPGEAPVEAYHSGSWMGTSTFYARNLETGISVIVLANGEDMDTEGLAEAIEAAVTP